jgi:DNA-binding transcriptional regulator YdaS (Cro superfamily)
LAEQVIQIAVEFAPSRALAIAAAFTVVLRSGQEPGEVLDVSRSPDGATWLVRLNTKAT